MPYLPNGSSTHQSFDTLVAELSAALGPSSGLDSADVNPLDIQLLMERYISRSDEWGPYALEDTKRTYTRNLIDEGNGKSNLVGRPFFSCSRAVHVDDGVRMCIADPSLDTGEIKRDS